MSARRIAYVVDVFPKISETFIASELVELRRRGVEVRILALKEPVERLRHEFIRRAGLEDLTVFGRANFPRAVEEFRPDLLHAHFAIEPTAEARALAERFDLPFTFTAHGRDIYRIAPSDFPERAAAASALVTVSEANARYIVEHFGVPREHIEVISCGVDLDRFRPRAEKFRVENGIRAASPSEPPLIVCVARYARIKNLAVLMHASAALCERGVRFRCVLVGDGPDRADLETARRQLGLEQLVELTGYVPQSEVLARWQSASVAALSSDSEGMPVSLMEAAACGVPAVATRVGGIPELVQDGVTGLLVPPGDAESLADALQRLLTAPQLAAQMGIAARRRAEEKFSLKAQVDRLLALWSDPRRMISPRRAGQSAPAVYFPEWYATDNEFGAPYDLAQAHAPIVKLALHVMDNRAGNVIDLGCGNGALLQKIHRGNDRIVPFGVDIRQDRIDHAHLLLPSFRENFRCGNIFDNDWIWAGDRRYALAIVTSTRLVEAGPEAAARLRKRLAERCGNLLVYAYGKRFGTLQEAAPRVGFRLVFSEGKVGLAVVES